MSAPYCHAPSELPDLRLWLAEQWEPGRPYATTAAAELDGRSAAPHAMWGDRARPNVYAEWERLTLKQASLWWIGPDMVDLLLATAAGIPDDATLVDVPPPHLFGLVVFSKPWMAVDSIDDERSCQVDAMLWGPTNLPPSLRPHHARGVPALSASSYRRLSFDQGLSGDELMMATRIGAMEYGTRRQVGTWTHDDHGTLAIAFDSADGAQQLADRIRETASDGAVPLRQFAEGERSFIVEGCAWAPLGRSDWPVGDRIADAPWPMPDQMHSSFVDDRRVLVALWTLLQQPGIAALQEERPARPVVRRGERAGVERSLSTVRVVRLRELRSEDVDGDEHEPTGRSVVHDHRWLVRGFWRWQPCGKGRAERRLTYVRPHIRGPEGTPLKVPETVHAWIR